MGDEGFKVTDKRGQDTSKDAPANSHQSQQHEHPSGAPDISFSNLIVSLGTSAMIHMGFLEDPHTKKKEKNLILAREEIDLIIMLQEKTKGNLSDTESKVVEQVLYELRLRFVEASK